MSGTCETPLLSTVSSIIFLILKNLLGRVLSTYYWCSVASLREPLRWFRQLEQMSFNEGLRSLRAFSDAKKRHLNVASNYLMYRCWENRGWLCSNLDHRAKRYFLRCSLTSLSPSVMILYSWSDRLTQDTKFSSLSLLRKAMKISISKLKRDSKIDCLWAKSWPLNAYASITINEKKLHNKFKKDMRKSYFWETSIYSFWG